MVTLRATQKLLRMLPPASDDAPASDTALGDWYAKRFVVDHQPLLLLVSSESLLSIITPARDVRNLPSRLPSLVTTRLRHLGVEAHLIEAEVAAMDPVHLGPTKDRSVTGSMVDFAKSIAFYLPIKAWDLTALPFLEARLAKTPCRVSGSFEDTIFPERAAPDLLAARWHAA